LGNVIVFHGRIHDGKAFLGEAELAYPESAHLPSQAAHVYVRPHELDIVSKTDGPASLQARVVHINPIGSYIRVQLRLTSSDAEVNVDISPRRHAELALEKGQHVFVTPQRIRVFAEPDGPEFVDRGSGI